MKYYYLIILLLLIGCSSELCPPECKGIGNYSACIADRINRSTIIMGDSGVCATCPETCGWAGYLDGVANFWLPGHQASAEIDSGYLIVMESINLNPDATQAIIHIGGNDLRVLVIQQSSLPSAPDCGISLELYAGIEEVIGMIMEIVQVYDAYGIHPIITSVHQVEENTTGFASCSSLFSDPSCLNEMLGLYSETLRIATEANGYTFVDFYSAFTDPQECEKCCECLHCNCAGHADQAEMFLELL